MRIPLFMLSVYDTIHEEKSVLEKLEICSLSDSQYTCLQTITMASLHECLLLFIHWVDYGYFEYCSIPISLKDDMTEADVTSIEDIVKTTGDSTESVISQMNDMLQAADHCQDYVCQQVSQSTETNGDGNTFLQVF